MENVEAHRLDVADYFRDPPQWLLQREPTCKIAALPASDRIVACQLISGMLGNLTFSIEMDGMGKFAWAWHFQLSMEAWTTTADFCQCAYVKNNKMVA
ncbi:hypothetical protein L6164_013227 [Bauhinia variegata]|uniref:Uncharacterized protein n=1 Tax=Bauhinia variegata TaxID=167791 RepID=A0ACB9PBE6_BAUVA|nr:hypothetical protein L6164_013227 [Bauhinia variegata]